MSDTEIHYKYKVKGNPEILEGNLTADRGLWKSYLDGYNNPRIGLRVNNCALVAYGNEKGQRFLKDICDYWRDSRYSSDYEELGRPWREMLVQHEIVELIFDCY